MRARVLTPFVSVALAGMLLWRPSPPALQAAARQVSTPLAPAAALTDAQMEEFLLKAEVVRTRTSKKGVTGTIQATLSDGTLTHDAQIQTVDERKAQFVSATGTEFNFRDSWAFNVAGYRLDRLLGMNMVPVSVSRYWRSQQAAFTWWIDDVLMEEGDRLKKKLQPPNPTAWNQQMQIVRLFDQLIANVDRNMGNLVITRDWRVWPIDHTRAFRTYTSLASPKNVTRTDRALLERLKALDHAALNAATAKYLTSFEIEAVLKRRDAIVKRLEMLGPAAVFERVPWAVTPPS
jgi:hypothetical protein